MRRGGAGGTAVRRGWHIGVGAASAELGLLRPHRFSLAAATAEFGAASLSRGPPEARSHFCSR